MPLTHRIVSEALGTAFLLTAVVGSGIMAQRLAGGNIALALLCNSLATGAILSVLILIFGPISGAHLNPAVTLAFALRGDLAWSMVGGGHCRLRLGADHSRLSREVAQCGGLRCRPLHYGRLLVHGLDFVR
jgi:glycerol uptake facilitator-like aquaporin